MPLAYMKHRLIYNAKGDVVDYQVEEVNPMFEECFAKAEKVVGKKGSELRGSRYNEFVVLYKKMFIEKKSFTFEYYYSATQKYYEIINIASTEPVSYTHLDVYKRQWLGNYNRQQQAFP